MFYFSISRVYWSTVDARRRCVYTCQVMEVKPNNTTADIIMKDVTIVHDKSNPHYDPQLDEMYMRSLLNSKKPTNLGSYLFSSGDIGVIEGQSLLSNNRGPPIRFVSSTSSLTQSWPQCGLKESMNELGNECLSQSWPVKKAAGTLSQAKINLSALSSTTLKLLNKSQISKFIDKPATPLADGQDEDDNDLKLTKIVERLNTAAAKNRKKLRTSLDGSTDGSHHSREGQYD